MTENNRIVTQFLADAGTTVTDTDCVNEVVEEIDPDQFIISDDSSAGLEVADGNDGSEHKVTGCVEKQLQATILSPLSRMLVDNDEATVCQPSESLVDLDAEDAVVSVVSNDISENVDMHLLPKDGNLPLKPSNENNNPITVSEEGCTSEENHSILSTNDMLVNMEQDDNVLASLSISHPHVDSAKYGRPSHSSQLVEDMDDVLSFSSSDHHSAEVENVGIHSSPEKNDLLQLDNNGELLAASSMKGTSSDEDCNIFTTNNIPDIMEEEEGILESSSVAVCGVDTAKSDSVSQSSEMVEDVDDVGYSSSLVHHISEAENVSSYLLSKDKRNSKSDATVACTVKETLPEEDHIMSRENQSILSTNDIGSNMVENGDHLESSSVTDRQVDTAKSVSPTHSSLPDEHADDIHSSSSLDHHSSEGENVGIHLLPEKKTLLKCSNDNEPLVACSMKGAASEGACKILPTNDISDNTERDDGLSELPCVKEARVDTTISDRLGHFCQLVDHVQCDVHENAVESVKLLPCTGERLNAINVATDKADIVYESAAESDQQLMLKCKQIPIYGSKKSTTETGATNSNAKSSHINKIEVVYSNCGELHKEDVILSSGYGVMSEPVSCPSSVILASSTGLAASTVISHDTKTVDISSHNETEKSTVILIKATSTQPSTSSVPHSSSSVLSNVLQHITSTAANSVSTSVGETLQLHDNRMPAMEQKSTDTAYRPAAALVMNIGKNLVTESILHEVVTQEQKWKDASIEEQVLVYNLYK